MPVMAGNVEIYFGSDAFLFPVGVPRSADGVSINSSRVVLLIGSIPPL